MFEGAGIEPLLIFLRAYHVSKCNFFSLQSWLSWICMCRYVHVCVRHGCVRVWQTPAAPGTPVYTWSVYTGKCVYTRHLCVHGDTFHLTLFLDRRCCSLGKIYISKKVFLWNKKVFSILLKKKIIIFAILMEEKYTYS